MMLKNIFRVLALFLFGVIISIIIDDFLKSLIQDLFRTLTNDSIYFTGKDFLLFPSFLQCTGFGIWMVIIWKKIFPLDRMQKLWSGFLVIGLFAFTLVLLSFLDGNIKVMQCTICDDGRFGIRYSEINYGILVSLSLFVSILPMDLKGLLKWIKNIFQNDPKDVLDLEIEKL